MINWQVAATPLPGDLPFMNYAGTPIGAYSCVMVDAVNVIPTSGDGIGVALPAAASTNPTIIGVTLVNVPANDRGRVRTQGTAVCIAGAALTPGQQVMCSTVAGQVGYVIPRTAGSFSVGVVLTPAPAVGDQVLVQLMLAPNA